MKTREEIENEGLKYGFYTFRQCVLGNGLRYIGPRLRFDCYGYSLIPAGEHAEYAFVGATPDSDFKVYTDKENPDFKPMEEENFILNYPQYFVTPLDLAKARYLKTKKPKWIH